MILKKVLFTLVSLLAICPAMPSGVGRFDSVDGTYDEQTGFSFEKTLYYQMRSRSIVGKLSRAGAPGAAATADMTAGDDSLALDGSSAIARKKITEGDMVRYTLQEHITGMPTYGDRDVRRGDFLAFKNLEARVNQIDSPAIPVVGRMSQQRAAGSISDLPAKTRAEVINYMEEQYEYEYLFSMIGGASPSALKTSADGGLGVALGVNALGTAGNPLMGKNWFVRAADGSNSFPTYSTTPATWNGTINTALNAIPATSNGYLTLAILKALRARLDSINSRPLRVGGKMYKMVWLCDPELWYRIDHLLATYYQNARERSASNPLFDIDRQLAYLGMLFINVPNLEKLRPAYNSSTGIPDLGPGLTQDFRGYTTTSDLALMVGVGGDSVIEGYNDKISVTEEKGKHAKGLEIAAHMDLAFIRSEWYAKDGRTDVGAVYNDSSFVAAFYEPGVGTGY